jgi:hypothetical protein
VEKGINDVGFFDAIIQEFVQDFPTLISSYWGMTWDG